MPLQDCNNRAGANFDYNSPGFNHWAFEKWAAEGYPSFLFHRGLGGEEEKRFKTFWKALTDVYKNDFNFGVQKVPLLGDDVIRLCTRLTKGGRYVC